MLYYTDLEKLVFDEELASMADKIAIISGYIGIQPVKMLAELFQGKPCIIVYGMYGSEYISKPLHESLVKIQEQNPNIDIRYSTLPVHSKLYFWTEEDYYSKVLIGSANFSIGGLFKDYKEVLSDVDEVDYGDYATYYDLVLENSISCLDDSVITKDVAKVSLRKTEEIVLQSKGVCRASLLDNQGKVPAKSGLNWCFSSGHVAKGDAYIRISKRYIKDFPYLFPPKKYDSRFANPNSNKRENDLIEMIWDDGTIMSGLLEGQQEDNSTGLIYPKQISSNPNKSIIGIYLRSRIGVSLDRRITLKDLKKYGRTHIDISIIGDGVYYMDFSVSK